MKLGEDVLLEIVDIVRQGILEGKDISEMLRNVDLSIEPTVLAEERIVLSQSYKAGKGRVA